MDMSVILTVSAMLALLPLATAAFFMFFTLPRKLATINQDLRKLVPSRFLAGGNVTGNQDKGSIEPDIQRLADKYFATWSMVWPPILLSLFYLAAFSLCDSYIYTKFVEQPRFLPYPKGFVLASVPVLYGFVGVYLFNLGTTIRRLYLADLNEQVFWGAINRLLLSLGLAFVMAKGGVPENAIVYFSIGFMANLILDWLLEKTLKLLDIAQPSLDDLPLKMVRGIDIWKEYRLEEEGIDNVQNLATADVLELAVRTHYSLRTLIDWIDQSIMLSRLTSDQVKTLTSQAMAISAIELAAAAPESNKGDKTFAIALASQLKVDPVLMAATLDRLYEDEFVRQLWDMWQSGKESPVTVRIPIRTDLAATGTQSDPKKPDITPAASNVSAIRSVAHLDRAPD